MTGKVTDLVAHAVGKHQVPEFKTKQREGCFYGWVIVTICIFAKIFKVQGQNNVMSYTVPHLLEDFELSHAELGGLFSAATIMAGMVQPVLGRAMDHFGGRVCIPAMQVSICLTLAAFAAWQRPEHGSARFLLRVEVVGVFFFLRMLSLGAGEIFPNACVQQWFRRRRGRAVGVVFTFQWLGNAIFGTMIAGIVAEYSWHTAAALGAICNQMLAPVSALVLRRSPEACGLLPDGYATIPEDEEIALKEPNERAEPAEQTDVTKFWAHFVFTFFYAVMFGGCDFYMVEMVSEAAGNGVVSVSLHIFAPFALASSLSVPCVGELMDAYCSRKKWLPSALLGLAGFLTAAVTMWLPFVHNWFAAVLYAVVRGITSGIFQSLLSAGLCFAALGVGRQEIGRILGYNTLCTLVGTGVGPFFYGTCRDLLGTFRTSLWLSGIPPLLLGMFFAIQSMRIRRSYSTAAAGSRSPAATDPMAPAMIGSPKAAEVYDEA